jgi:hypothetical protein
LHRNGTGSVTVAAPRWRCHRTRRAVLVVEFLEVPAGRLGRLESHSNSISRPWPLRLATRLPLSIVKLFEEANRSFVISHGSPLTLIVKDYIET